MSHEHCHAPADYTRAFAWGVGLNIAYIVVEAGFGLFTGSLALLADAGHNLSDVLGLLLAWGGHFLAKRRPTKRYTYGFRSSTIIAAVTNAMILLVAVAGIFWEAIRRFSEPQLSSGATVMAVAGIGVLINGITTWMFVEGRDKDLNIRGAFLHMAADTLISLAVVLAGLAIMLTGATWIDPAAGILVAIVIFWGTWGLLRDSVNLLLQAVPKGTDIDEVAKFIGALDGVEGWHDLHIWPMSTTETALTVHLLKPDSADEDRFLADVGHELDHRFGIGHVTIQIERGSETSCRQSAPESL